MKITRKLLGVIAAVILVAGGMLHGVAARADNVASLDPVQGMVQRHAVDEPEDAWQTVLTVVPMQEGDGIRTDQYGLAYLTFFEGVEIEILPSSVLTVSHLKTVGVAEGQPFDISLQVLAGDALSHVEKVSDPASRYEIVTPGASMTVRGTEFWTSVSPAGVTTVRVVQGTVEVSGIMPDGQVTPAVSVTVGSQVTISAAGKVGPIQPVTQIPQYPPQAPLAPATCGNGQCEAAEQSASTCPLDCNPPTATLAASQPSVTVQNLSVNLRSGPGMEYSVVGIAHQGERFIVIAQANGWWLVQGPDDSPGWIAGWIVAIDPPDAVVELAATIPAPPAVVPAASGGGAVPTAASDQVCAPGQWAGCGAYGCAADYSAQCNTSGTGYECIWNPSGCSSGGGAPTPSGPSS